MFLRLRTAKILKKISTFLNFEKDWLHSSIQTPRRKFRKNPNIKRHWISTFNFWSQFGPIFLFLHENRPKNTENPCKIRENYVFKILLKCYKNTECGSFSNEINAKWMRLNSKQTGKITEQQHPQHQSLPREEYKSAKKKKVHQNNKERTHLWPKTPKYDWQITENDETVRKNKNVWLLKGLNLQHQFMKPK